jgi:hypothetical protein
MEAGWSKTRAIVFSTSHAEMLLDRWGIDLREATFLRK